MSRGYPCSSGGISWLLHFDHLTLSHYRTMCCLIIFTIVSSTLYLHKFEITHTGWRSKLWWIMTPLDNAVLVGSSWALEQIDHCGSSQFLSTFLCLWVHIPKKPTQNLCTIVVDFRPSHVEHMVNNVSFRLSVSYRYLYFREGCMR